MEAATLRVQPRPRAASRVLRVGIAIGVLVAGGTALALSVTPLRASRVAVFEQAVAPTDFQVQELGHRLRGPHRVEVTLALANGAAAAGGASATVQLLDASGEVLAEGTHVTGPVGPGGVATVLYTFHEPDLAARFTRTFVVLEQP